MKTFTERLTPVEPVMAWSDLSDIMTVGIGLYLALGIVQALSAGGVAGIRRRSDTLERTIRSAKLISEYSSIRTLQLDIGRVEIGFEFLNRSIIWAVTLLFLIALCPFILVTLWSKIPMPDFGPLAVIIFYIVLPCSIYVISSLVISKRCKDIVVTIKALESRVKKAVLG